MKEKGHTLTQCDHKFDKKIKFESWKFIPGLIEEQIHLTHTIEET
jgi:hypothetical protein